MHPGLVRSTKHHIQAQIDKLHVELSHLRNVECKHPAATKEHKGDTGNWSPSDDSYWTEFYCPDCGKSWDVDGSV